MENQIKDIYWIQDDFFMLIFILCLLSEFQAPLARSFINLVSLLFSQSLFQQWSAIKAAGSECK